MKRWALLYGCMIVVIVMLADMGKLGFLYRVYDFPYGDKAGHFLLFGLLSLTVDLAAFEARPNIDANRLVLSASVVLALLIGLEELSQRWIATRTFSLLDLAASYLGVTAAAWLAVMIRKRRNGSEPTK